MIDCRCVPAVKTVHSVVLLCPQFSVVLGCGDYRIGEAFAIPLRRLLDSTPSCRNTPLSISIVAECMMKSKMKSKNENTNTKRNNGRAYPKSSSDLPKLV